MIGMTFFYHFTRFLQGNAAKHFFVSLDNDFFTALTFVTLLLSFFFLNKVLFVFPFY